MVFNQKTVFRIQVCYIDKASESTGSAKGTARKDLWNVVITTAAPKTRICRARIVPTPFTIVPHVDMAVGTRAAVPCEAARTRPAPRAAPASTIVPAATLGSIGLSSDVTSLRRVVEVERTCESTVRGMRKRQV